MLDLGMFFQVAVAFACAVSEISGYTDPNAVVVGQSCVALWMLLCGLLVPNAPLRSAATAFLCVLMWPLGYWVDQQIFGFQPLPLSRMLVWVLPLAIVAVWMLIINHHVIRYHIKRQRADDIGSYVLTSRIGNGGMGEVWRARHKMLARGRRHQADPPRGAPRQLRPAGSTAPQAVRAGGPGDRQPALAAHCGALTISARPRGSSFYYVMELLDGIDLQTLVEQFGADGARPRDPHSAAGLPVTRRGASRRAGASRREAAQYPCCASWAWSTTSPRCSISAW